MTFRKYLPLLSLLTVLWVSCFSGLTGFGLVDLVDEGFYATIARQMAESGDWITPRIANHAVFEKPPLLNWTQALFIKMLGPTVLAARLPSALAAALTSLLLWWWVRKRSSELAGWLAGVIYALCPLAMGLAHIAMTDTLLTLWLTIAIMGAIEGFNGKQNGYLAMGIGAGLATLTKGVIGFLLPGATIGLWLIWQRDWQQLKKPRFWIGIVLFFVLALPWHLLAWRANGQEFLRAYFWQLHVQTFVGHEHDRPFWFYLPVIICAAFPFIVLVPRAWFGEIKKAWLRSRPVDDISMWAVWAALVLIFFSASQSKLSNYILPVLPALAVMVAIQIDSLLAVGGGLTRVEACLAGLFGVPVSLALLSCAALGISWRALPSPVPYSARLLSGTIGWQAGPMKDAQVWYRLSPFIVLAWPSLILGALILVLTLLVIVFRRRLAVVITCMTTMGLAISITFAQAMMPMWSRFDIDPLLQLAESTRPALDNGQTLVLYDIHPARVSVRYLLGHPEQIVDTTDAPVLQETVTQNRRGRILTKVGTQMPELGQPVTLEKVDGHWMLWRYGQ